jgi:hypothetical protein
MRFCNILFLFTFALAGATTPSPGSASSLLPSSSYDINYEQSSQLPEHDGGGHGGGDGGGGGHSGGDSEGSSGSGSSGGSVAGSGGGSGGSTGDGSKMSNGILSLSLASVGLATLAIRVLFL